MHPFSLMFALFAGMMFALQVVVNSQARGRLELHPFQAALINFGGGTFLLAIICLIMRFSWPTSAAIRATPWWIWTGGALGIIYIFSSVLLGQRLGVTLFLTVIVAGQMTGSLVIDHYGVLGASIKPINPGRLFGVGLVLVGVGIVAISTSTSVFAPPIEEMRNGESRTENRE